jgi:pimeloyl-ACP methyl ester carboxylesterase
MSAVAERLFLPGWGARTSLYRSGLGDGWTPLEPPPFRAGGGALAWRRGWIEAELDRRSGPVALAGHSLGAALAISAAASWPEKVASLVLIAPAGLPLTKPIRKSVAAFAGQVAGGRYPLAEAGRAVRDVLRSPRTALRLARSVQGADLTAEMQRVREASIPTTVVGCTTDTLVTPELCREAASLLGATYREVSLQGGHMWMLDAWPLFAGLLASTR